MTKNIEIQNEIMENQIEKQNIGMSVDIDIEVTENEIKNKKCSNGKWNQNEIKISAWVSALQSSTQYKNIKCKFLYYLKKMTMTIHLDCYATTDCKPEVLSGVETGNRIPHDEWNLRGIAHMYTYTEKTTFLCKDD